MIFRRTTPLRWIFHCNFYSIALHCILLLQALAGFNMMTLIYFYPAKPVLLAVFHYQWFECIFYGAMESVYPVTQNPWVTHPYYINQIKSSLILSWRKSLSYRNQSTDFQSKSMDWFLYDRDPRHERINLKNEKTDSKSVHELIYRRQIEVVVCRCSSK